ncbi:MAG: cysteine synthase family protein [Rhodoferax sp.]|nr:cysteine synthase family protein [Rhodoferax sp.]
MHALGARVIELPSEGGGTTRALIQRMMERARELAQQPGAFYADQFNNPDAADGYASLAQELWAQTGGSLDAFVQSVGTAQCITGVARGLRARHPRVQVIAVEPSESAVLSGGAPGSHKIEGVGPGFVAPIWRPEVADAIQTVSTADAMAVARRLAREEAIFAGTSTGANVVAALQVAARLGPQATVVTLACDSGLKYLSTPLFSAR